MDEPPPDAYERVTNPERFAVLHDAARRLVDRLVTAYDVTTTRTDAVEVDDRGRRILSRITVCPSTGSACLEIALDDFPGVVINFGDWTSANFPSCGCDACDENPPTRNKR